MCLRVFMCACCVSVPVSVPLCMCVYVQHVCMYVHVRVCVFSVCVCVCVCLCACLSSRLINVLPSVSLTCTRYCVTQRRLACTYSVKSVAQVSI